MWTGSATRAAGSPLIRTLGEPPTMMPAWLVGSPCLAAGRPCARTGQFMPRLRSTSSSTAKPRCDDHSRWDRYSLRSTPSQRMGIERTHKGSPQRGDFKLCPATPVRDRVGVRTTIGDALATVMRRPATRIPPTVRISRRIASKAARRTESGLPHRAVFAKTAPAWRLRRQSLQPCGRTG